MKLFLSEYILKVYITSIFIYINKILNNFKLTWVVENIIYVNEAFNLIVNLKKVMI